MTRMRVHMSALDQEYHHDFDVEVEVNGDQVIALQVVVDALPNHVWYRWLDLDTGENGRNHDAFPVFEEDWDEEVRKGWKYLVDDSGLPLEVHHGGPPLYKNDERMNKKPIGRAPSRA